jgi:hypothetical protein
VLFRELAAEIKTLAEQPKYEGIVALVNEG